MVVGVAAAVFFGGDAVSYESPNYRVVESIGPIEIREMIFPPQFYGRTLLN